MQNFNQIFKVSSPLDQFEIKNLLKLEAPFLANLQISLSNISLYLTIAAFISYALNATDILYSFISWNSAQEILLTIPFAFSLKLESPPKPHAFASSPLQSFTFSPKLFLPIPAGVSPGDLDIKKFDGPLSQFKDHQKTYPMNKSWQDLQREFFPAVPLSSEAMIAQSSSHIHNEVFKAIYNNSTRAMIPKMNRLEEIYRASPANTPGRAMTAEEMVLAVGAYNAQKTREAITNWATRYPNLNVPGGNNFLKNSHGNASGSNNQTGSGGNHFPVNSMLDSREINNLLSPGLFSYFFTLDLDLYFIFDALVHAPLFSFIVVIVFSNVLPLYVLKHRNSLKKKEDEKL